MEFISQSMDQEIVRFLTQLELVTTYEKAHDENERSCRERHSPGREHKRVGEQPLEGSQRHLPWTCPAITTQL